MAQPQSKALLALDQATNTTGWALFIDGELSDCGTINAKGYEEQKIDQMRQWLHNKIQELVLNEYAEIRVAIEDIQQHGTDVRTFKILAHLQGVLVNELYRGKISYEVHYAAAWKSSLGIKGRDRQTQKKNAQNLIKEKYGKVITQDTCDAICIGLHDLKSHNNTLSFE